MPRPGPRAQEYRQLLRCLVALDFVAVILATLFAGLARLVLDAWLPVVALGLPEHHAVASVMVVPVLLILFRLNGLYDLDRILAGSREYAQIAHAATYGVLMAVVISFLAGDSPVISRSWLLLVWLTCIGFTAAERFAVRRVVRLLRLRGALRTRVVVIGASTYGVAIAEQLNSAKSEGLDVVGFLDEYAPLGQELVEGVSVIGRPSELIRGFGKSLADEYILVPGALPHERLEEISRLMVTRSGPALKMAVTSNELMTHGVLVAERASVPLITLQRARIVGVNAVLKRTLDIVGALAVMVVTAPLVVLLLGWAMLGRRGSPLIQQRVHNGSGELVGFWLFARQVSTRPLLRGLPALWAVLTGTLSLVGPRPVPVAVDQSTAEDLHLTAMRPGLTGPWRLCGAGASMADQAVRDLAYARQYSIWEDLRLLWESMRIVSTSAPALTLTRWQTTREQ